MKSSQGAELWTTHPVILFGGKRGGEGLEGDWLEEGTRLLGKACGWVLAPSVNRSSLSPMLTPIGEHPSGKTHRTTR